MFGRREMGRLAGAANASLLPRIPRRQGVRPHREFGGRVGLPRGTSRRSGRPAASRSLSRVLSVSVKEAAARDEAIALVDLDRIITRIRATEAKLALLGQGRQPPIG